MTTYKSEALYQEDICTINKDDHPFVTHKSIINYEDAITPKISNLASALGKGLIEPMEDASPELIKRIQDGAKKSEAIPEKCKKFFGLF